MDYAITSFTVTSVYCSPKAPYNENQKRWVRFTFIHNLNNEKESPFFTQTVENMLFDY